MDRGGWRGKPTGIARSFLGCRPFADSCRQIKGLGIGAQLGSIPLIAARESWGSRSAIIGRMTDVTQILSQIKGDDLAATARHLPMVCDELRNLASVELANEMPDQTLQAAALVHELTCD
jgi:hypothetical protein